MNRRDIIRGLIKEGLSRADTMILDIDSGTVTPLRNKDIPAFRHVTGNTSVTRADLRDIYADIFIFHGLNLIAFNANGSIKYVKKK